MDKRFIGALAILSGFLVPALAQNFGPPSGGIRPLAGNEVIPLTGGGRSSALVSEISTYVSSVPPKLSPTAAAAFGATQGTATALTSAVSIVSVASSGLGVEVPNITNTMLIVYNSDAANSLNVWPLSGMSFGAAAANAAISLGAGRSFGIIITSPTTAIIVFNSSSFG